MAVANAATSSRGEAGRLVLGIYTSLSSGRLRDSVSSFAVNYPQVELHMIEGSRSEMIEGIRSRTIDLTIMYGPADSNIGETLSLWSERAHVILPTAHHYADRQELTWSQIADEPFLFSTRDAGPEAESALLSRLGGPGRWFNRRLLTISRETLHALVAMEHGVALMIESDLGHQPATVVAVPLSDENGPTLVLMTAYRDPSNDNPPLRRFWSLLKANYALPE